MKTFLERENTYPRGESHRPTYRLYTLIIGDIVVHEVALANFQGVLPEIM